MKLRFQADADFRNPAVMGIARRWPFIDIRSAQHLFADGVPDEEILAFAANEERVLLTHDVATMPEHFLRFIEQQESPGLILVRQNWSIASMMGGVYTAWSRWTSEDLRNSIRWLPRPAM